MLDDVRLTSILSSRFIINLRWYEYSREHNNYSNVDGSANSIVFARGQGSISIINEVDRNLVPPPEYAAKVQTQEFAASRSESTPQLVSDPLSLERDSPSGPSLV